MNPTGIQPSGQNPLNLLNIPQQIPLTNNQNLIPIQAPPATDPNNPTGGWTDAQVAQNILPTGGAILGDLLGGPLLGAGGAAGGQALADVFAGKTPGWDVPLTGGVTLGGGLLAKGVGGLLTKILGGAGEDLATGGLNLTKSMTNKLAQTNGESVLSTITKNKLAGADSSAIDSKLSGLYDYHGNITKNIPMNFDTFATHADDALTKLKNSPVGSDQTLYNGVNDNIQNILGKMGDGSFNLDDALSQFDKATSNSQFGSGQWGANRYTGDILRKTMYDIGDANGVTGPNGESLKTFGLNLRNLQNISDAAAKREGMGSAGKLLGLPDLLGEDVSSRILSSVGANPLLGLLYPARNLAGKAIRSNPMIAGALSKILSGGADLASKATPLAEFGAISSAPNLLNNILNPQGSAPVVSEPNVGNNNTQNNNQQNSQTNSPLSSYLNGGSNPQQGQTISQNGQNVNGVQRDQQGHFILPDVNSVQTQIPGQVYPPELQQQDIAKVAQLPFYMQDSALSQIRQKASLNDQIVGQYLSQHALAPEQKQLMDQLPQTNDQMNYFRDLLKTEAGKNVFQAVTSDNHAIQYIKSQQDPQYAQMLSLMKTLRASAEYAQVHGRLSNFDIQNLSNMPGPGDTTKTALGKLDLAQATLANQYQRFLPQYGYSLLSGNNQTPQGGADLTGGLPQTSGANPLQQMIPALYQSLNQGQ